MPRTPLSPWENFLVRAQQLGELDAAEGLRRPKLVPQIVDALGIKSKLDPGQLATLKSIYEAGFYL